MMSLSLSAKSGRPPGGKLLQKKSWVSRLGGADGTWHWVFGGGGVDPLGMLGGGVRGSGDLYQGSTELEVHGIFVSPRSHFSPIKNGVQSYESVDQVPLFPFGC